MNKLHTFAFYALVTPALTLGAGSVLAQYSGDLDSGRLQQGTQIGQDANPKADRERQRNQRDQSRTQARSYLDSVPQNGMHASNLMGTTVYTNSDDDIGSVDDLILDGSGKVVAVIVGVGGFLGMGEKDIAIGWDDVTRTGAADELKLRVNLTRDALKAAPEFVTVDELSTTRNTQRDHNDQRRAQMQSRGHIAAVPHNGSHASNLIGMDVETNDDESIGSVDDLVIDSNGQVVAIVVSVGGFLGIGQKDVAIGWGNVTRSGTADDQELRANVTRDALKSAPEFASRN
ncbi:PRC-barrel domain-containing protein [Aliidiomarina shirensis]|nr:PRC-barrel domain-containing protein [Aliidiomarina shirensis]